MRCEFVAGGLCIVVGMAYAGNKPPVLFSQRYALDVSGDGAYFRLTLPPQVYAASKRSDLGDLRVFNGEGELVPFSLVLSKSTPVWRTVLKPTAWFPVQKEGDADDKARLGVSVFADGTLRVEVATAPTTKRNSEVILVDLGGDSEVAALWVRLGSKHYQGRIHVEASNDLNQWQTVADAALLKVFANGKQLMQERVALNSVRQRYLRLSWPDGTPDISNIEVENSVQDFTSDVNATDLVWQAAAQIRAGTVAGEYLFESGGAYPVERLRISLPQRNTVVRVTIQSRNDNKSPWSEVANGTVFRLQGKQGGQVSAPLRFDAMSQRHWRMLVDMHNGGIGGGLPQLALGWRPAVLTFVARGSPPFTLGVGNAALTSIALSTDALLQGEHTEVRDASVGALLSSESNKATDASPHITQHTDAASDIMQRTVLWVALIAAVLTLSIIAWQLARTAPSEGKGQE